MNLKKAILLRSWIAFTMVLTLAGFIVRKVVVLQFFERDKYEAIGIKQSTKWREIIASRGNIYTDDGSLLATSVPRYEIRFDTKLHAIGAEEIKQQLDSLAFFLSKEFPEKNQREWYAYLYSARKKGDRYLLIHNKVDYVQAKTMENWPLFRLGKNKGGFIKIEKFVREIPFGNLARRTIGYTSGNNVKIGLEGAFDSFLAGVSGKRMEQRMAGGGWRPVNSSNSIEPKNGVDVYTTIDINLQDVAEDALYRALSSCSAKYGCALLMEVETGAIKAIANLKQMTDGSYSEVDNFALNDFSDPGSTFKILSALALLDDGHITTEDSVDVDFGKTYFGKEVMIDAHPQPYKRNTFRYVFEHSSNVGMAKAIVAFYKNNPFEYVRHIKNAGLDKPIEFDIPIPNKPLIKTPETNDWSVTSLPWMSIGYEMRVSPLQLISVYNAIANNGIMVKPYLVNEIKEFNKTLYRHETEVITKSICKPETIKQLKSLLEGVVENGTGSNLKGLDYKVAGKTGTAQIALNASGYDKSSHKASFVGYFPADNPKYTCMVVISAPAGAVYYGGLIAGPVFREISDKIYATNFGLHKTFAVTGNGALPEIKHGNREDIKFVLDRLTISSHSIPGNSEEAYVNPVTAGKSIKLVPMEFVPGLMPDVTGMGLRDAIYVLENKGLKVQVEGYGSVYYQSSPPGTGIYKGMSVFIRLKS